METETELPRNAVRRLVKGKLDAMAAGAEANFSVNKEVRGPGRPQVPFPAGRGVAPTLSRVGCELDRNPASDCWCNVFLHSAVLLPICVSETCNIPSPFFP